MTFVNVLGVSIKKADSQIHENRLFFIKNIS